MTSPEGLAPAPVRREARRDIGFDVIRVMASMMVVVIHVSASLFYRFEAGWVAANVYDSLSRSAVPLFFMISGALLVPRDSDLKSVVRRAAKMIVPLVFGSYFYLLWWTYNRVQPPPDLNPLSLLKGPVVFHLWFFYTLLGVYLFLPLLQGLYRKAKSLQFFYLAMVVLAASIIPTLRDFGLSIPVGVDLQYFAQYAGYTFAGAVLAGIRPTSGQTLLSGVMGVLFSMGDRAMDLAPVRIERNGARDRVCLPCSTGCAGRSCILCRLLRHWQQFRAGPAGQGRSLRCPECSWRLHLPHFLHRSSLCARLCARLHQSLDRHSDFVRDGVGCVAHCLGDCSRAALRQVSPAIGRARQVNSCARHDGSHSPCSFARCEPFWPIHWPAGSHLECATVFPRPAAAVRGWSGLPVRGAGQGRPT